MADTISTPESNITKILKTFTENGSEALPTFDPSFKTLIPVSAETGIKSIKSPFKVLDPQNISTTADIQNANGPRYSFPEPGSTILQPSSFIAPPGEQYSDGSGRGLTSTGKEKGEFVPDPYLNVESSGLKIPKTYEEIYAEKNPEPAPSSSTPSRFEILSGKRRTSPPDFINPSLFAKEPLPGIEPLYFPEEENPTSVEDLPGVPADGSTAKGFVEDFFEKLSTWSGAVPLQSFWVIVITFPKSLTKKIEEFIRSYDANPWVGYNINVYKNLTSELYQSKQNGDFMYGCFFARSINIPGEKIENVSVNFTQQGLLFPNVVSHRAPISEVSISFAETNDSFMDIVVRPWSILGGYLGSVARSDSIKGTIEAIFYAKTPPGENLVKRKSFIFNDVIPIDVNTQEYTQAGDAFITRSAKFLYSNYTVKNESLQLQQLLPQDQPQRPELQPQQPQQSFPANPSQQWQEWFKSQPQQPEWKAIRGNKSSFA